MSIADAKPREAVRRGDEASAPRPPRRRTVTQGHGHERPGPDRWRDLPPNRTKQVWAGKQAVPTSQRRPSTSLCACSWLKHPKSTYYST